jgi:SAM-dependent methyltransferase
MIDASRVTAVIMETRTGTIVPVLPTNEAQARPLAKLRDKPETMQEAWTDAVELADGGQPTAVQVAAAVGAIEAREAPPKPAIRKPDLDGQGLAHPARYSKELYPLFADLLAVHILKLGATVLDPFAGTGGIHRLQDHGYKTAGIEIETEWAALHPGTVVGSALDLPFGDDTFDAIVTSPTYGNRLADSHNAADPELRRSYTHDLGHELNADNSGAMHWGDRYRRFHEEAWIEAVRVLAPSGVFLLNVKDHIRRGARQHVAGWHVTTLCRLGLTRSSITTWSPRSYAKARTRHCGSQNRSTCSRKTSTTYSPNPTPRVPPSGWRRSTTERGTNPSSEKHVDEREQAERR